MADWLAFVASILLVVAPARDIIDRFRIWRSVRPSDKRKPGSNELRHARARRLEKLRNSFRIIDTVTTFVAAGLLAIAFWMKI